MTAIQIDRKKYSSAKSAQTWLDKFIDAQAKDSVTREKTIKVGETEKVVNSNSRQLVAHKLFTLIEKNGFNFPGIRAQVEAEQRGAIGRARMIFAGALKRKIARGEKIFDNEGNQVGGDEFEAYKASLPVPAPKPVAAPTVESNQDVASDIGDDGAGTTEVFPAAENAGTAEVLS